MKLGVNKNYCILYTQELRDTCLDNPFVTEEIQSEIIFSPQTNEKRKISVKAYGKFCSEEKIQLSVTLLLKKKEKKLYFKNVRKITS